MQLEITCAKCGKLVDKWLIERREDRMGQEVHVECHGDTDTCFISDRDVQQAGPRMDWTKGTAFTATVKALTGD